MAAFPLIKSNNLSYRWVVLIVAFITLVLGYAIRNCFSVFYPTIVEEFGWQRGNTALIFSISVIVYGLTAPVAGGLADRFGPRIILPIGSIIMGGGIALCSRATTQWEFYLFYGVLAATGLSLAGWTPLTVIVSNWFVNNRGLSFGILSAGFGGSLVYATLAQFLISTFGWQTAYIIIGGSSIAIIVPLCGFFIRERPKSTILSTDDMMPSSETSGNLENRNTPEKLEQRWSKTTWTLTRAMKTYQYWLLFFMGFCLLGIAEYLAIAHGVYFFRDVGYRPMLAANVYSMFGITFVLGNICSFLSDRLGREKVFILGCLLCLLAVCLLFFIQDSSRPWMGFFYAVFFGFGMGIAAPVFFTTVADLFLGKYFGAIQGTIILGVSLAGAVAPWLGGFLHDKTGNYMSTYLLMLGSLLLCILLMWLIAPRKLRPVTESRKG